MPGPAIPAPATSTFLGAADGAARWTHPHLLELRPLPAADIRAILALARQYRGQIGTGGAAAGLDPRDGELRGRVVANLFFEDSTRTRVSFSVAARRLGAEVIDLTSVGSSVSKGETVGDTALNIAAMGVDAVVVRHRSSGAAGMVARTLEEWGAGRRGGSAGSRRPGHDEPAGPGIEQGFRCSVINAGDGRHEHPTQGLLDAYTVADAFDRLDTFDLSGLSVGIVGDIGSSRVARSDVAAMTKLGARVICIGPPGLVPAGMASLGCEVSHDLDGVLGELDAVNVLRIQFERHEAAAKDAASGVPRSSNVIASVREYAEFYGLGEQRAARLKKGAVVMHPGPINRGVELTSEVADSHRSVVLRQVTHGVAVRMAVLRLCLGAMDARRPG